MRLSFLLLPAAGLSAALLAASPSLAANTGFDLTGRWAAEGKACAEAGLFLEFDGRDIVALQGPGTRERVAGDYSTALEGRQLVVRLTKADTSEADTWSFVVDGSDAIRLDSSFFAGAEDAPGLMKLTRCPRR